MALRKCKECGNDVSSKAKKCPNCGIKIKKGSAILRFFGGFLILLFIISMIDSMGGDSNSSSSSKPSTPTQAPPKVSSKDYTDIRIAQKGIEITEEEIRTGPSMSYDTDNTGDLLVNEKLYVLDEKNDWIKFRVTSDDEGWSAWTRKDLTISLTEIAQAREEKFGKTPYQIGTNGSVRIVKDYLRTIAKDPSSLEYDKWSKVYYNENDGWIVYCVFRGKNSFGGYDKTANWFVIQHGRVIEMKDADAYRLN